MGKKIEIQKNMDFKPSPQYAHLFESENWRLRSQYTADPYYDKVCKICGRRTIWDICGWCKLEKKLNSRGKKRK